MSRFRYVFEGTNLIETIESDVDWHYVRDRRTKELQRTDYWALKDLTMSQAKKDYRAFLRDLPQTYETANEAYDAMEAYEIPE
tara:strand:+ start:656 stop:904 length:249 start_codon:yes stop_codon:yes gene_type:complete